MPLLVGIVVVVVALLALAILIGQVLPVSHVATRTETFTVSPDEVWEAIHDPALTRGWGGLRLEDVESVPPRRWVRRIVGETAFGGTWTYEIIPGPAGSTLAITERGEVYNPLFRFVSRFVIGHHRTIDSFLAALRTRFAVPT